MSQEPRRDAQELLCLAMWCGVFFLQILASQLGFFTLFFGCLVAGSGLVLLLVLAVRFTASLGEVPAEKEKGEGAGRAWGERSKRAAAAVLVAGAILVAMGRYSHPTERIFGANDQGLYVSTALHLAATGTYDIAVPELSSLTSEMRRELLVQEPAAALRGTDMSRKQPRLHIGLFFLAPDRVSAQFPLGYPVWLASAYASGGWLGLKAVGGGAMVGSALLMGLLAAGWMGRAAGLSAFLLALFLPLHLWIGNSLFSEPLLQLLWLASLRAISLRDSVPHFSGLAAGLCLGLMFYVKIDALLILPVIAVLGITFWKSHPAWSRNFLACSLLPLAPATLSWLRFNPFYFGTSLATLGAGHWIAAVFATTLLYLAVQWFTEKEGSLASSDLPLRFAICGGLLLLMVWGVGFRPQLPMWLPSSFVWDSFYFWPIDRMIRSYREDTAVRLGWYWSVWGAPLALAGVALMAMLVRRPWQIILWVVGVASCIALCYDIRNNPLQPYSMRRFVPFGFPCMIMGAVLLGCTLGERLGARLRERWKLNPGAAPGWLTALPLLLLTGALLFEFRGVNEKLNRTDEFGGLVEQMKQLADNIPADSVVLMPHQAPFAHELATPLHLIFGRFVLLTDPAHLKSGRLNSMLASWRAGGRSIFLLDTSGGRALQSFQAVRSIRISPLPSRSGEIRVVSMPQSPVKLLMRPVPMRIRYSMWEVFSDKGDVQK